MRFLFHHWIIGMGIAATATLQVHPVFAANARMQRSSPHELVFPDAAVVGIHTVYVPFNLVGQLIVVQAQVDTLIGNFIIDTGAEYLLLNSRHFEGRSSRGQIMAVGNTGSVGSVMRCHVDTIHIDQLLVMKVPAHILDLGHIEDRKNTRILGILGYSVYKDFEIFIDFPNRLIMLSRIDKAGTRIDSLPMWESPVDSLDFIRSDHAIIIPAEVNGVRLRMMLDTGAELNLLDRHVRRRVLDNFTILKRVNLVGINGKEVEVLAGVLEDVHCGNQPGTTMNTLLTDLDEINASFGVSVHGVIGYEFLNGRRVMINYAKEKLYFFGPWRS